MIEIEFSSGGDSKTIRTWVVDRNGTPTVVYDANPHAAASLKSARELVVRRAGKIYLSSPKVFSADSDETETAAIFEQLSEKYGDRNRATDIYYSLLGRTDDKDVLIIKLQDFEELQGGT